MTVALCVKWPSILVRDRWRFIDRDQPGPQSAIVRWPIRLACGLPGAVFARSQARPLAEGAEEHAGFGVAEQQGDFRRGQASITQMLFGQLPARIGQQLLVTAVLFGQASLQGAFAEVERS